MLLHNRYRAEGGEERVVRDLAALLSRRGNEVELIERSSSATGRVRAGRSMLQGGERPEEISRAVRRMRAQLVHAHNLHPLFGWRALAAARAAGARTVLQLHNFRLFCAIGVAFRDGAPCYSCHGTDTLPGFRHRCRGSISEAAAYAVALHRQQRPLLGHADRFVVLSDAHGARLMELGLPAEKTAKLANFLPSAGVASDSRAAEQTYALVSGRLVEEKGYDLAIDACRAASVPLVVAGTGPDEAALRRRAAGANVRFTGWVEPGELAELRSRAALVLVPSRCEEACPYAVLDALADGVPVLVSDRGGLPEMVDRVAVLPSDDVGAWAYALAALWGNPKRRLELGRAGLRSAHGRFGEEAYYERLMAIYESAIDGAGAS
ncbi:MAG: glycosyltransferase family 4 protein [Solirubrobacterales bacterium]|nr:glycosyltransferase family 4 protein [Solirubrobacterales bacterium]